MKKKNNSLIIILMGIIIVILAVLCVLFATGTIDLNSKESSNEVSNQKDENKDNSDDMTCNYTSEIIEEKVLNYFTKENGITASNGEKYVASSLLDEGDKYIVRISHLQNDHDTTDENYIVSCIDLKGNLMSDTKEIDFNN